MCKEYKHKNGYVARLYGKAALSVYFNGKEVLHTGSRNVNTKDEVMKMLEGMPVLLKLVEEGGFDENKEDN